MGGPVDATEIKIGGTTIIDSSGNIDASHIVNAAPDTLASLSCPGAGSIAVFDGTDWTCQAGSGSSVNASDLVGTIAIGNLPVGLSNTDVAAGDHSHTAADVGALALSGGTLTGSLGGTDAAFTGDVSAATLDGQLQQGNLIGRLCPQDSYLAYGYCLPKDGATYTEKTDCSTSGSRLYNGVCMDDLGCAMADHKTAYAACQSAGGRLCSVRELDRLDGSGCGGDYTQSWALLTNDESKTGSLIGSCIRRGSEYLADAGVTAYEIDGNDQIAACDARTLNASGATGDDPYQAYNYCCFDN